MFFINALNQHISGRTTMRGILLGTVVCLCCIIVNLIILPVFHAAAAASTMLNFQARLMTANGAIVPDGYYNVEFKLYSGSTGGTALWTEDYYDSNGLTAGNDQRTQVKNGYLTVNLGSQTAFPTNINWDQQLFLTMNVGGTTQTATPTYDGEMNPRLQLTAVPYAFKAGDSNTLGGLSAGQFIQNQIASAQSANIFLQSASSAGNPTVQVQQASGQTGDLLQFRNSSGVLIGKVDSSANIAAGNFVDIAGTGPFLAFGAGATIIDTRSAGNTGLVVKGQAGQSGNLLQLQNSAGNALAGFTGSGALYLGLANSTTGSQTFYNSTNSNTVTLQSGATTSSYTLTLPTADGTSGQCLSTDGAGALAFSDCGGGGSTDSFDAYDATGGVNIGTGVAVGLDTVRTNTSTSKFTFSGGELTINNSGVYNIQYRAGATLSAGTRGAVLAYLEEDTGSGFAEVPGTRSYAYGRITTYPEATAAGSMAMVVTGGDKFRLHVETEAGTFSTVANGGSIVVVDITSTGGGGGTGSFIQNGITPPGCRL